ncbi:putative quinol monooxygenase [Sphingorhabdus sp.]|uniref:putative quinol monooxygenase n=1 Tax=Sphingorhabdus sp. TaxID=1902408 RepID=UPI0032B7ABFF
MILITGHIIVRPERRAEALALGTRHSQRSRAEPGCFAHNCHLDAENENRIVFVEEWADMAAVKTHFAVPESGEFVRELSAMSDAPPVMRIWEARPVEGQALHQ